MTGIIWHKTDRDHLAPVPLQKILGDIFCSVAIVLDRPFEVGDFIVTGDHMGTVERIGIKTAWVRSLEGEQIIFPNSTCSTVGSAISSG